MVSHKLSICDCSLCITVTSYIVYYCDTLYCVLLWHPVVYITVTPCRLDPALIRPGRVDLKAKVDYCWYITVTPCSLCITVTPCTVYLCDTL